MHQSYHHHHNIINFHLPNVVFYSSSNASIAQSMLHHYVHVNVRYVSNHKVYCIMFTIRMHTTIHPICVRQQGYIYTSRITTCTHYTKPNANTASASAQTTSTTTTTTRHLCLRLNNTHNTPTPIAPTASASASASTSHPRCLPCLHLHAHHPLTAPLP